MTIHNRALCAVCVSNPIDGSDGYCSTCRASVAASLPNAFEGVDIKLDLNRLVKPAPQHEPIRDHDSATTYSPFVNDNGQVGYRCVRDSGETTYIYLNASGGSDDGVATVFVYQGEHGTPESDSPLHNYEVWNQ